MTEAPRSRLTPQLADYDRLGMDWRAYLMFCHSADYRSAAVNTDAFGLRYSETSSRRFSPLDQAQMRDRRGVIVGGSTCFGVGAGSDAGSIASRLGEGGERDWFNLGARAYSGSQELILFDSLLATLGRLESVVMFSGLNDLLLPAYVSPYDEVLGAFYFNGQFRTAMAELQPISRKRALLRWLLGPLLPPGSDFRAAPLSQLLRQASGSLAADVAGAAPTATALPARTVERALAQIGKNLSVWAPLLRQLGCSFHFVLQPNALWCKPAPSAEEQALFDWLDDVAPTPTTALIKAMDLDVYDEYRTGIATICDRLGVRCHDMNPVFRQPEHQSRWLFVDRAHLTDDGNAVVASQILRWLDS